jgi:Protein of unknown function (DUF2911)
MIEPRGGNRSRLAMDMKSPVIVIVSAAVACGMSMYQAPGQMGPPVIGDAPPGGGTPAHAVLSPPAKTSVKFQGGKVAIAYSSPSMRKRVIFGELVPFNKVWRAGANDATALQTDLDLKMDGLDVPKGDYTLFVWVDPKQWQLIVNRQTGQSGLEYDPKRDLGRVPMQMSKAAKPIEHFRITLSRDGKSDHGRLELAWETTLAAVDFIVAEK